MSTAWSDLHVVAEMTVTPGDKAVETADNDQKENDR